MDNIPREGNSVPEHSEPTLQCWVLLEVLRGRRLKGLQLAFYAAKLLPINWTWAYLCSQLASQSIGISRWLTIPDVRVRGGRRSPTQRPPTSQSPPTRGN